MSESLGIGFSRLFLTLLLLLLLLLLLFLSERYEIRYTPFVFNAKQGKQHLL